MECRICRSGPEGGRLVRACRCHAWVHASCLQRWLDTRPAAIPRTRDGEVLSSLLCCEVCKSKYLVRIESRMDSSRLFSPRSCEAYFGNLRTPLQLSLILRHSLKRLVLADVSRVWEFIGYSRHVVYNTVASVVCSLSQGAPDSRCKPTPPSKSKKHF